MARLLLSDLERSFCMKARTRTEYIDWIHGLVQSGENVAWDKKWGLNGHHVTQENKNSISLPLLATCACLLVTKGRSNAAPWSFFSCQPPRLDRRSLRRLSLILFLFFSREPHLDLPPLNNGFPAAACRPSFSCR